MTGAAIGEGVDIGLSFLSPGSLSNVSRPGRIALESAAVKQSKWFGSADEFFENVDTLTDVDPALLEKLQKQGWNVKIVREGDPDYVDMLTCFRFFGQMNLLFWTAQGELSDVESQVTQAE